jgi:peptide/nickel transport system substrate-binding protein
MALSRRGFLKLSAMTGAGLTVTLIAACAPQAPAPAAPAKDQPSAAQKPASAATPKTGGDLVVGFWSEPRSLDPMNANAPAVRHIMALYDTLIVQSNDFKYHPALAESWEVSPDGTAYAFKLKKGVKFHDGTPFNAQAVKHNLDRFVLPEATANVSVSLAGVYKTTEIVDDYTARIILEYPFAPFLDGIAEGYNSLASPTAVEKFGKDYGRNPVGTGPFIFEEWKANSAITMKRNPDYTWGSSFYKHQSQSYLDKVSIRLIPEIGTRLATLETGEVQVAEDVPPEEVERLKKDANIQVVPQSYPGGPAVLEMNTANPPLDDLLVRQAICWSVKQEDLVKNLFSDMTTVARTHLSPGTFGYVETVDTVYKYDPEKSKELLEQAGWKAGPEGVRAKDGKPLEIGFNNMPADKTLLRAAELIQANLRDVGIKVNMKIQESGAHTADILAGRQHLTFGWRAATDPDFLRPYYHSKFIGHQLNRARFKDDELDQLLIQGAQEQDRSKRPDIYKRVQDIILKQALVVPLWHRNNFVGARSNVNDFSIDLRGYFRLYDVSLS